MDASNLLKPALQAGTLRCIGSTTYKEYRQYFEKDRALVRRFQKIDVAEPTIPDTIKILKGLKPYYRGISQGPLHRRRDQGGGRAGGEIHQRPQAAGQGDRRDRRGRRVADAAAGIAPQESHRRQGSGRRHRQDGAHSAKIRVEDRYRSAAHAGRRSASASCSARTRRSMRCRRRSSSRARACASRKSRSAATCSPARPASARPKSPSSSPTIMGVELLRFDMSRIHGAPHGQPPDRRAAGLCRLRPGRPADRRRRPASALRAAARRDREGASGPVQHPAAGDGSRQAHRSQRQEDRFPQRGADHDHQCGRVGRREGSHRLRPRQARRRGRRSDQEAVHAGIPQPPRCDDRLRAAGAATRSTTWSRSSCSSSKRSLSTAT